MKHVDPKMRIFVQVQRNDFAGNRPWYISRAANGSYFLTESVDLSDEILFRDVVGQHALLEQRHGVALLFMCVPLNEAPVPPSIACALGLAG